MILWKICFCSGLFLCCEQMWWFTAQVGDGSGKHIRPQTLVLLAFPFPFDFQPPSSLPSLSILDRGLISKDAVYVPQIACLSHVLLRRLWVVRKEQKQPRAPSGLSHWAQAFPFPSVLHCFVLPSFKWSFYFRAYLKAHWAFCLQRYFAEL